MPENIYSEYNVDVNKLTRDYQKFPLKKIPMKHGGLQYEDLPKEDFVYLYIECNLPRKILAQYFNVSEFYISKLSKKYKVKKSPKRVMENVKKTWVEKYGVENVFQTEACKEKSKQTNLQKLGVEHPAQSPIVLEKMKQTNLQNYGVENYAKTDECKEKIKQTNLERYGVEYYSQTDECKEKSKQTSLKKFGTEYYSQTDEYKERIQQTCIEKYGVENVFQTEECKEKSKQTCIEKYGVENYAQSDEWKEKVYKTKKENGSFGKSEEENKIYDILLTKFNEVIRQYKSELYPFFCDFYIPEIDLYIEYQGYFTHGDEPYLGTNEQNDLVNFWNGKGTEQYLNAVKTWTNRDPLKRDTARKNNLNWLEFFTMNEFIKWFESI